MIDVPAAGGDGVSPCGALHWCKSQVCEQGTLARHANVGKDEYVRCVTADHRRQGIDGHVKPLEAAAGRGNFGCQCVRRVSGEIAPDLESVARQTKHPAREVVADSASA